MGRRTAWRREEWMKRKVVLVLVMVILSITMVTVKVASSILPPLPLLASPLSLSSPLSPSAQVSERKQAQPSPPPLSHLVHLRELWLARNRLSSIGWGLRGLVSLTSVSLQANRLSRMVGVGCLPNLEELYLSMNGIEVVEDVEHLPKLRVLDLAQNKLRVVANLPPRLEDLWLNNNALEACSWTELTEALAASRDTIISLYLENNPQLVDDLVSSTVATTTATTMTTTADGGGRRRRGTRHYTRDASSTTFRRLINSIPTTFGVAWLVTELREGVQEI